MLRRYVSSLGRWSCFAILLTIVGTTQAQTTQNVAQNLVTNSGFEDGISHWMLQANGALASAVVDQTVSRSGNASLRFTNATPYAPNVWFRAYQSITTQPFTTYRISCWVKGEDSGDCFIAGGPGWGVRASFPQGTFDWQEVSTEWSTGATAEDFELMLFTHSRTTSCWIDDVQFVAIRTDEAKLAELRKSLQASVDKQKEHLEQVSTLAQQHGKKDDPYVQLGLSVARRFIDRIDSLGPKQNMSWSRLQMEEVDTVLKETADAIKNHPEELPGTLAWPDGGPVEIRDGIFYSGREGEKDPGPVYFGGYGAFNAIFRDLPNFRDYGVSLIQDGRAGPSSLNADGSTNHRAKLAAEGVRAAAEHGVKVDLLLSPHYFPEWGYEHAPDLRNGNVGFIDFNIDHPKAREVIERWLRTVVPTVKDQRALFSYCLSNEPVYVQSGKDPYSRPKWVKYLQEVHGEIATLNALYGTSYKSFDDVVVPTRYDHPEELNERRAYFDWCRFNQVNFADWHRWMNDIVKSIDPDAKTHAKLLVAHAFDHGTAHYGVDMELFCEFTDIAGCDNAVGFDNAALTSWPGVEFYYDLLHSFRNQPVFNSELHFIPDAYPAQHIPYLNSRAVIWQGALHHLGAATTWVWEEPGPGLLGSIYLRPANIYGVGRALLDLNRLAKEVAAINQAKPRIALLYSQPSLFWEKSYAGAVINLHAQLKFAGEKVTFVSERQLAAGRIPEADVIISPRATHVADSTVQGLRHFVNRGGRLIVCGESDLQFDQYHRQRTRPVELANSAQIAPHGGGNQQQQELISALHAARLELYQLSNANGDGRASSINYRIVDYDGAKVVPIINMTSEVQTVRLPDALLGKAVDLLTGQPLNPDNIRLDPMVPMLLRVQLNN